MFFELRVSISVEMLLSVAMPCQRLLGLGSEPIIQLLGVTGMSSTQEDPG